MKKAIIALVALVGVGCGRLPDRAKCDQQYSDFQSSKLSLLTIGSTTRTQAKTLIPRNIIEEVQFSPSQNVNSPIIDPHPSPVAGTQVLYRIYEDSDTAITSATLSCGLYALTFDSSDVLNNVAVVGGTFQAESPAKAY